MKLNALEHSYQQIFSEPSSIKDVLSQDCQWHGSHPINDLLGIDEVQQGYFALLKQAMPDIERKPFISFEDQYQGETWVSSTGYFTGTFSNDLHGIPATKRSLFLRYMELAEIKDSKVVRCYTLIDFIDAMNQAGVNPIRASLGHDGLVMPPTTMDGLCSDPKDLAYTKSSIELVKEMHAELGRFDGVDLASMDLLKHWHPDFIWYGPGGIGTTRGVFGFQQHHQAPFLIGFPDRGIDGTLCFTGHNNYVATGGWPHMYGSHTGDNWLGLKATNKRVYPRVMDFWRREGDLLRENWVAIDIIDMMMQMGIDVFAQMHKNIQTGKRTQII
ncbi:ester cyclase [Thalassomonas sp. M1454]|uniref:ester cyclase n=1 Tax=Thalassomonas sp. M1454 TaxID=2594477 RepID=UPI00117FB56B|nr:ester cyclase [Thalassomonas sp. M1454]TRX56764.1 ester cyclase [Thalassomonas sp. M1454]